MQAAQLVSPLFRVLYVESDNQRVESLQRAFQSRINVVSVGSGPAALTYLTAQEPVDLVLYNDRLDSRTFLTTLRTNTRIPHLPVLLLTDQPEVDIRQKPFLGYVIDVFPPDYDAVQLRIRLDYLIQKKEYSQHTHTSAPVAAVRLPVGKRLFDIALSLVLLILALPLLLVAAVLIKLDSKGPIFYGSKRVGAGFRVFNMYKFRTMRTDADQLLAGMASQNLYNKAPTEPSPDDRCETCRLADMACQRLLFMDNKQVCEILHQREQRAKAMFSKFKEDPRVTRLGKILRNTSIDELPQLFNILRGDMSFVGNRPLPLYEAEKLTTIGYDRRFAAPAGLTGLWQVTKRGKASVSDQERIQLDILYAKNYSLRVDLLILLKTFKAVWQKENV